MAVAAPWEPLVLRACRERSDLKEPLAPLELRASLDWRALLELLEQRVPRERPGFLVLLASTEPLVPPEPPALLELSGPLGPLVSQVLLVPRDRRDHQVPPVPQAHWDSQGRRDQVEPLVLRERRV